MTRSVFRSLSTGRVFSTSCRIRTPETLSYAHHPRRCGEAGGGCRHRARLLCDVHGTVVVILIGALAIAYEFASRRSDLRKRRVLRTPRIGRSRLDHELLCDGRKARPSLIAQIHRQPLRWRLIVIVGQPGDPTHDPTIPWPEEREKVDVGTLTLDRVESERQNGPCTV
jgi:hypothetical protein